MSTKEYEIKPHESYLDSIIVQCVRERKLARADREWRWNTVFWMIQVLAVHMKIHAKRRRKRQRINIPRLSRDDARAQNDESTDGTD